MKIKQKTVKNNMYQVKKKERKRTVVNIPYKWISITSFFFFFFFFFFNNVILNERNYKPRRTCSVIPVTGMSNWLCMRGPARRWHSGVLDADQANARDSYMV